MHTYERSWLDRITVLGGLDPCDQLELAADLELGTDLELATERRMEDRYATGPAAVALPTVTCVADVVEWASDEPDVGTYDWLDVWHLRGDGVVTCTAEAGAQSSIVGWAVEPGPLVGLRLDGLDKGDCGTDWLIVDARTRRSGTCVPPCRADRLAFAMVQEELADVGVRLLDAVVFDDDGHWWSLRELVTGSTAWPAAEHGP